MISRNIRNDGRSQFFRIVLGSFVAILLTACGGDNLQDLKTHVAKVKAKPQKGIKPLPEIKTVATFVFDPEGLRNPFLPSVSHGKPVEAKVYSGIKPNFVRHREELESYSLDSLRMVGTVDMSSGLWGLIRASDGTIHRVKTGNYMGKNHGKIFRILEDGIEMVEIVGDGPESWRERQASMKLVE